MAEKDIYPTIKQFFNRVLKDNEVRMFNFVVNGKINCKTPKRPMTMEIIIPSDICHGNIEELEDWRFFGVAIPEAKFVQWDKEDEKNNV